MDGDLQNCAEFRITIENTSYDDFLKTLKFLKYYKVFKESSPTVFDSHQSRQEGPLLQLPLLLIFFQKA